MLASTHSELPVAMTASCGYDSCHLLAHYQGYAHYQEYASEKSSPRYSRRRECVLFQVIISDQICNVKNVKLT